MAASALGRAWPGMLLTQGVLLGALALLVVVMTCAGQMWLGTS
jgi:hypothetical protein